MTNSYTLDSDNSVQQNQKIFSIYNIYRLVLSLILVISFWLSHGNSSLGSVSPELFKKATAFYVVINILSFFIDFLRQKKSMIIVQLITITLLDILLLIFIAYTCGGVISGMAYLTIVPVATSSILFRGRLSVFLAAVGTISIMYSETYLYFTLGSTNDVYTQVALIGLVLFTISILLQYLGGRIRQNELITAEQANSIESLEAMNYQIIQRMQTGIVVVDGHDEIINYNSSTKKMLHNSRFTEKLLPSVLLKQLKIWKINGENPRTPFQPSTSSPKLQASFSYLNFGKSENILIFLEDFSLLSSRAQHLKLMSLGRLTASIAHEVRNPLGAISHASQLLSESSTIDQDDQRLLEIIENHSKRINSIIENVLQLSRDKSALSELISIKIWLDGFIQRFSNSYMQAIQINIEISNDDIVIRFNPSLLEQLLTNLCDNGIRYSLKKTQQSQITVKIYENPLNQSPILDVIDNGEGVPEDRIESIFEPFFTTESSGTGLGLFICEEICEANQAQLSYHINEDEKSCFRISFAHPDRNIM